MCPHTHHLAAPPQRTLPVRSPPPLRRGSVPASSPRSQPGRHPALSRGSRQPPDPIPPPTPRPFVAWRRLPFRCLPPFVEHGAGFGGGEGGGEGEEEGAGAGAGGGEEGVGEGGQPGTALLVEPAPPRLWFLRQPSTPSQRGSQRGGGRRLPGRGSFAKEAPPLQPPRGDRSTLAHPLR